MTMTKQEIKIAKSLLAGHTDRIEVIGAEDGSGLYLTAYWLGGGQKLFYTLDAVREYLAERGLLA